jgi:hypothetical protein
MPIMKKENKMPDKWLENLKIGDKIIINSFNGGNMLKKIIGETPKYWKIGKEMYRKNNGKKRGEDTNCRDLYLIEPTEELVDEIYRERLLCQFQSYNWSIFSLDQLQKIADIVNSLAKEVNDAEK